MDKYYKDALESYKFMQEEIEGASDRAAAIVSCAFLDDYLQRILKAYLTDSSESADGKLFGNNGPLSTFSSKITILYRLGLISQYEHNQLNILRKIRNLFAHNVNTNSFDTPNIRSILMSNIPNEDLLPPTEIPLTYKPSHPLKGPSTLELITMPESDVAHEELAQKFHPLKFRVLDQTNPRNIFENIVFIIITCLNVRYYDTALSKCAILPDFTNILDIETHKINKIDNNFCHQIEQIERIDAIIADSTSQLEKIHSLSQQERDDKHKNIQIKLENHLRKAEQLKTEIIESPDTLCYALAKLTYILVKVNFNKREKTK